MYVYADDELTPDLLIELDASVPKLKYPQRMVAEYEPFGSIENIDKKFEDESHYQGTIKKVEYDSRPK